MPGVDLGTPRSSGMGGRFQDESAFALSAPDARDAANVEFAPARDENEAPREKLGPVSSRVVRSLAWRAE